MPAPADDAGHAGTRLCASSTSEPARIPSHVLVAQVLLLGGGSHDGGRAPALALALADLRALAMLDRQALQTARGCGRALTAHVAAALQREMPGFAEAYAQLYPAAPGGLLAGLRASDLDLVALAGLYAQLRELHARRPRSAAALGARLCEALDAARFGSDGAPAVRAPAPKAPGAAAGALTAPKAASAGLRRLAAVRVLIALHMYVRDTLGAPRSRVRAIRWAFSSVSISAVFAHILPAMHRLEATQAPASGGGGCPASGVCLMATPAAPPTPPGQGAGGAGVREPAPAAATCVMRDASFLAILGNKVSELERLLGAEMLAFRKGGARATPPHVALLCTQVDAIRALVAVA
jgi:hypothetical protein